MSEKRKTTQNEIARGVGQYVGMMYSVEALDQVIAYLQTERARIYAILMRPLQPKQYAKETGKK